MRLIRRGTKTSRLRQAIILFHPAVSEIFLPCSIEDAKQKAEHDRKMKQAEEKKLLVRRQIASLRRTFAKLHTRNGRLPSHLQLGPEAFVMDPDIEMRLKEQTDEKVELVHKEMSWESEKHKIALNKLQKKCVATMV